jgi:hypothetical protein
MDEFFSVTITGEETLTNDLNDFIKGLRDPIWEGLSAAADGMKNSLQAHIQSDVYDAYEPKSYPRRSKYPNYGLALNDLDNKVVLDVSFPNALSMLFNYTPVGYHSGKMQDTLDAFYKGSHEPTTRTNAHWDEPLKPHPVHGDKLIQRIQTGEGYDWKPKKGYTDFPRRPFWSNFVEEQRNGAIIENFAFGFSRSTSDLRLEGGKLDLEWDANDGVLEGVSHDYSLRPEDQISMF